MSVYRILNYQDNTCRNKTRSEESTAHGEAGSIPPFSFGIRFWAESSKYALLINRQCIFFCCESSVFGVSGVGVLGDGVSGVGVPGVGVSGVGVLGVGVSSVGVPGVGVSGVGVSSVGVSGTGSSG